MFNKLKEKFKNWTSKIAEEAEEKQVLDEKPIKKKKEKKFKKNKEKDIDKKLQKEIESGNFEKPPMEFNVGTQAFQPDTEKITKKSFFQKISSKEIIINEKEFEKYEDELKFSLLENNVAYEVANKIISELKEKIIGKEFNKKEIQEQIQEKLKEIINNILIEPFDIIKKIQEKSKDQTKEPYVILFCGINGSGKTTTIAKIANLLKKNKISCVLAAADTFRAASIEQINQHGEKLGIKVISQSYGVDPASVGFEAIQYAKKNKIQVVLIDTAGRMHTSKNLLREIEKVARICNPDNNIFIGESITGNDSIEQIKAFNEYINLDGIILTKADIDEKGGTALSLGHVTKKPILYLGTGQKMDDIVPFNKEDFIKNLEL